MIDDTKEDFFISGGRGPGEIANLSVKCVQPGAGMFGRDKKVSMAEATEAVVSYLLDGRYVDEARVTISEARRLLEQAEISVAHAVEQQKQATAAVDARKQEIRERLQNLRCPVCDGHSFDQQISREDSQMGFTTFRMQLLICRECSFVMHFAQGQSWFVPG
jgi:excinuclease UvrABC ATPase subunit